jgi:AcrR family transcriptional regulator
VQNGQDAKQRVFDAAKRLFVTRGYAATSLRAIGVEAGTSDTGILRFYEDKVEILQAVIASCWSDLNAYVDAAVDASQGTSDDPRVELLDLVRILLQATQDGTPASMFLVGHSRWTQLVGLDERGRERSCLYADEYHRYRGRIENVCTRVLANNPAFARRGISAEALTITVLAVVYGVSGDWFMAERDPAISPRNVTIDEVLAVVRGLLYDEAQMFDSGLGFGSLVACDASELST